MHSVSEHTTSAINRAACFVQFSSRAKDYVEANEIIASTIPEQYGGVKLTDEEDFILQIGSVAELVGIEGGVVSGVFNLESSDVGASDRRPRHEENYHEVDFSQPAVDTAVYLFDDWFDPIEAGVRDRVRGFIQAMIEGELDETFMRPRYGRRSASSSGKNEAAVAGHRHGHRSRSLTGTFGRTQIAVPRARLLGADGKTTEWKSKVLRTYQRRTLAADALIASAYLAGINTRRVRRALKALFAEGIGKDVVSRVWRK